MRKTWICFFSIILFISCGKDDNNGVDLNNQLSDLINEITNGVGESAFILPDENNLLSIPQDPQNPLTVEKVALGRLLFHETAIGLAPMQTIGEGTFSCASCHFAGAGFQAGRFQGIGDGGTGFGLNGEGRVKDVNYEADDLDVQPIRSPTVMNGAYQTNMLWNGQFGATGLNVGTEGAWTADTPKENNHLGFEGLETQAIAGLGVHRMLVDEIIVTDLGYKELFDAAFGSVSETDRYTIQNAGLAIAAYERTVLSNQAPFQKWLKGDRNALSEDEKKGAILFFGDAGCVSCHSSPALNSMAFHAIGMKDLYDCPEETFKTAPDNPQNLGRGGFTGELTDYYKFKVPQLYNLKDSPFYGHGASLRTVKEVVEYFNNGMKENSSVPDNQLADEFRPLNLSSEEINQITLFIEDGLYDDNLNRYVPESLPSGNCFPNHDEQSKIDLGCN